MQAPKDLKASTHKTPEDMTPRDPKTDAPAFRVFRAVSSLHSPELRAFRGLKLHAKDLKSLTFKPPTLGFRA